MPKATSNAAEKPEPTGTEMEISRPGYSNEDLRALVSFDDALALMRDMGVDVEDVADAIGDGFALLKTEEKNRLVDVPLLFLTWSFAEGDQGEYVVARVLAQEQHGMAKYVITDGSVGVYQDLLSYTRAREGKIGGLRAMKGLSRSDYKVEIDGKLQPATTYYINLSK